MTLAAPIGIGKPNLLLNALYEIVAADRKLRLEIFTGLTLVRPRTASGQKHPIHQARSMPGVPPRAEALTVGLHGERVPDSDILASARRHNLRSPSQDRFHHRE